MHSSHQLRQILEDWLNQVRIATNKQQNSTILFLQINLVVKDQTTYHHIISPDFFRLLWLQGCGVCSSRFADAIILQGLGRIKDYLHVISDTKIKSRRMACEHIFYILRPPFKQSYVSGPGHVPLLGSTVGWGKCKKCSKRFGFSRRAWTSGDVGTFRHLKMDALLFC